MGEKLISPYLDLSGCPVRPHPLTAQSSGWAMVDEVTAAPYIVIEVTNLLEFSRETEWWLKGGVRRLV